MLNTLLWIAQALVALTVALTGATKLLLPRELLVDKMRWAATWPRWRIKLLGIAEVAGAIGLVAPWAMGVAPLLTPFAALCIAMLMAGAVRTHRSLGEGFAAAAVVGLLCVAIAAGRLATLAHVGA